MSQEWSSRYQTPVADLFGNEKKLAFQLQVELALLKALGEVGIVPTEAYTALKAEVDAGKVTVSRVAEIEKETHHDIMAMVMALTETNAQYGGYVHFGATSQDINDTVTALQLQEVKKHMLSAVDEVRSQLTRLAKENRDVVCIARTHGQHAIPTTMGFKFANFLYELTVARGYVERSSVDVGKLAGAVGTYASVGTDEVAKKALEELGLQQTPITTQVVSRLHYAELLFALTAVASVLEKLCKEIRNLQRTEIGELWEGFVSATQVGSSTMPQKKNPHKSERVCGLARIVRAQLNPQVETIALEHERDLTNSSVERITLATSAVITHYMLLQVKGILSTLNIDKESVARNLNLLNGNQLAERIMMALVNKLPGGRQEAHHLLKKYSQSAEGVRGLKNDPVVSQYFDAEQFDKLLAPETYIGLAPSITDKIVAEYGTN